MFDRSYCIGWMAAALLSASVSAEQMLPGGLVVGADGFGAFSYVEYEDNDNRQNGIGSFNLDARLPVGDRVVGVAQVRFRSSSGFPRHHGLTEPQPAYEPYPYFPEERIPGDEWAIRDNVYAGKAGQNYDGIWWPPPPERNLNRVELGDLYVAMESSGGGAGVVVGRFILPFGFAGSESDNAATFQRNFAVNHLIVDALSGSSVDLPRGLGAQFNVGSGRLRGTVAVMHEEIPESQLGGFRSEARQYFRDEGRSTVVARVVGRSDALFVPTAAVSGLYSSVDNLADLPDMRTYGGMIDLRLPENSSGGTVATGFAVFAYDDQTGSTDDWVAAFYGELGGQFGRLRHAARYSAWLRGKGEVTSDWIPKVGYSLFRDSEAGSSSGALGASQDVHRLQFALGWMLSEHVELHAELLADHFPGGITEDDRAAKSMTTIGVIAGIRARI